MRALTRTTKLVERSKLSIDLSKRRSQGQGDPPWSRSRNQQTANRGDVKDIKRKRQEQGKWRTVSRPERAAWESTWLHTTHLLTRMKIIKVKHEGDFPSNYGWAGTMGHLKKKLPRICGRSIVLGSQVCLGTRHWEQTKWIRGGNVLKIQTQNL